MKNKSEGWSFPSVGESWKEDIVKLIPQSKRRNELIKYIELIDWEKISKLAIAEIKTVMREIGIPQINASLKINTAFVEAIILANIKKRLHYLFLHCLSGINKNDTKSVKNRKIKNILSIIESEIKFSRMIYVMIINFSSLKLIKDSEEFNVKINELQKDLSKYDKFRQHDFDDDNLDFYGKVYKKIDEYIEGDKEVVYTLIARPVVQQVWKNASYETIETKYKSFMAFKNRYKIYNTEQFDNFLSTIRK